MFWFKKEKHTETEIEDAISEEKHPLKDRINILYDNLSAIKSYDIKDAKLNFDVNKYGYGNPYYSRRYPNLLVEFDSNLGKVTLYIIAYQDNGFSLKYLDKNGLVFYINCIGSSPTVEPCFSQYNNLKAQDIDLALYELEHYIEEKHLDKASLESYNARELNKLINISAKRLGGTSNNEI